MASSRVAEAYNKTLTDNETDIVSWPCSSDIAYRICLAIKPGETARAINLVVTDGTTEMELDLWNGATLGVGDVWTCVVEFPVSVTTATLEASGATVIGMATCSAVPGGVL